MTPKVIYQSADFRLTDPKTRRVISPPDESAKTLVFQYPTWTGFVTYTGLGQWDGKDISDWIADWVADGIHRPSMAEIAAHLESEGTKLLKLFRRRTRETKPREHTFTFAGFEDRVVRAFVISNFEDCHGNSHLVADQLSKTTCALRRGSGAIVIVTGSGSSAVPTSDRRILRQLALTYADDGGRIRRRMQKVNAAAAASLGTNGGVSPDCVVVSFRGDGYGVLEFSDAAGTRPGNVPTIINGVNLNKMLSDAMKNIGLDMSGAQMQNATFVSTNNPGPVRASQKPCRFTVEEAEPGGLYDAYELSANDFETLSAQDINDAGHVIGTGRVEAKVPWTAQPWVMKDGQVSRLILGGHVFGIGESNQIAVMLRDGDGERAAIYQEGSLTVFPLDDDGESKPVGTNSSGAAVNGTGTVAGYVRTHTGVPGPLGMKAAVFHASHPPIVLNEAVVGDGTRPADTRAVDINEQGQVLVLVSANVEARSILWHPQGNSWEHVGGSDADVKPIALNNEGVVLGFARSNSMAVTCRPGGAWELLGTSENWDPVDINDAGDVIGNVMHENLFRPSLRLATGQVIMLPYITGHSTSLNAINSAGQIVGTAQADHGGHAVIWRRD